MKKVTLIAALITSAFSVCTNAATTSATLNITGKVIPGSCTISTGGSGGSIDFGTIKTSELTTPTVNKRGKASLSVDCQTDTTAFFKVSGANGFNAENNQFATDKDFATYAVGLNNITVTGGNAAGNIIIPADKETVLTLETISSTQFQQAGNGKSVVFPLNGTYFAPKASDSLSVGTFRNVNADVIVSARIDSEKAKAAVQSGEQVFGSVFTFELNYI
ncbi:DUF1120 domain-containing protein [Escherichia coli]|uniref:DUF1120 domain-containing protein n=1 Tax=Escherichia coli TaxID=562 RepID=UPI002B27D411|nr:DUF1120 domain-containing protein [Escherichia coli]